MVFPINECFAYHSSHFIHSWFLMSGKDGILMAQIVSTPNKNVDIQQWLTKLKAKFQHDLLKWNPNVFIVDDINVQINIIKYKSFFLTPKYHWDEWRERWTPLHWESKICIEMNSTGESNFRYLCMDVLRNSWGQSSLRNFPSFFQKIHFLPQNKFYEEVSSQKFNLKRVDAN